MNSYYNYHNIISLPNLCAAWREFVRGKKERADVKVFALNLSDNIFDLHQDLASKTYTHGGYQSFAISDPKPRSIHKATVRDRLLHHAIYRVLYHFFNDKFIYDSYSCRNEKGTHKAIERLQTLAGRVSKNHSRSCWALKCDIRKFFDSIDHQVLLKIVNKFITDQDILWLLDRVVSSFCKQQPGKGKLLS